MEKPKTELEKKALCIAVEHYVEVWDNKDYYEVYQKLENGEDITELYDEVLWDENIGVPHWNPQYLAKKIHTLYQQITFTFKNKQHIGE